MKLKKNSQYQIKFRSMLFIALMVCVTNFQLALGETQKSKYSYGTIPLSQSNSYFKTHFPALFWNFIPYYTTQKNDWTCGIASGVMIINAIKSSLKMNESLKTDQPLADENDVIQFIKSDKKLSKFYPSFIKRGVGLEEMGIVLEESLKKYGIKNAKTHVVMMTPDSNLEAKEKTLHQLLIKLENSNRDFIIPNFDQGVFTGDGSWGHFSPVAAYNSQDDLVLIMDTDRKWFEPYWISRKKFSQGMQTQDKTLKKSRGYIHIELLEE